MENDNLELSPEGQRKNLYFKVIDICEELRRTGEKITIKNIVNLLPDDIKSELGSEENYRIYVFNVLDLLENQKYLKHTLFESKVRSEISITNKGKRLVQELLLPIYQAVQSGEIPQEWEILENTIASHIYDYASLTSDLYYPTSNSAIRKEKDGRLKTIIDTLKSKEYTRLQLSRELQMAVPTLREDLKRLLADEKIQKTQGENKRIYYSLLEK